MIHVQYISYTLIINNQSLKITVEIINMHFVNVFARVSGLVAPRLWPLPEVSFCSGNFNDCTIKMRRKSKIKLFTLIDTKCTDI
jgi:hypothetical protein